MTLEEFIDFETDELDNFESYWLESSDNKPDMFPLDLEHETGMNNIVSTANNKEYNENNK